uniref:Uncharacterized protein n=1 Tax=Oryza nivara TaxID=4536 RepID=A0A0E0IHJ7_ORYNI
MSMQKLMMGGACITIINRVRSGLILRYFNITIINKKHSRTITAIIRRREGPDEPGKCGGGHVRDRGGGCRASQPSPPHLHRQTHALLGRTPTTTTGIRRQESGGGLPQNAIGDSEGKGRRADAEGNGRCGRRRRWLARSLRRRRRRVVVSRRQRVGRRRSRLEIGCLISPSPPLLARLSEGGDGGGGAESGGGGSGGSPPSQIWPEGEGGGGRTAAAEGGRCGEWRGWRFPSLPDLAEGGGGRAAPVSRMEAMTAIWPKGGGERAVVARRVWRRAAEAGVGAESRGSGAGGSPPSQIWPEGGGGSTFSSTVEVAVEGSGGKLEVEVAAGPSSGGFPLIPPSRRWWSGSRQRLPPSQI